VAGFGFAGMAKENSYTDNVLRSAKEQVERIRADYEHLHRQIEHSRATVARSIKLLNHLDHLKAELDRCGGTPTAKHRKVRPWPKSSPPSLRRF